MYQLATMRCRTQLYSAACLSVNKGVASDTYCVHDKKNQERQEPARFAPRYGAVRSLPSSAVLLIKVEVYRCLETSLDTYISRQWNSCEAAHGLIAASRVRPRSEPPMHRDGAIGGESCISGAPPERNQGTNPRRCDHCYSSRVLGGTHSRACCIRSCAFRFRSSNG